MPATTSPSVPTLTNGDRLTRREFERRYKAMPDVKKAELIEGTVYLPPPVHASGHGRPHSAIIGWLHAYDAATPGVASYDNATVRLDLDNEPQPDALLRIEAECGGQSRISEDDYVEGPPELVVEIAHSSAAYDLHDKKQAYRRNGVREYLVWQIEDDASTGSRWTKGLTGRSLPTRRAVWQAACFPASRWTSRRCLRATLRRC